MPRLLVLCASVAIVTAATVLSACRDAGVPVEPASVAIGDATAADGVVAWRRAVTTADATAQRRFDEGFMRFVAFDHEQARRAFAAAARQDPQCAMAHWGVALTYGPHDDRALSDADAAAARAAVGRAAAASGASALERALIAALVGRHAAAPPGGSPTPELAYASAMQELWRRHPDDADIAALAAAALMLRRPADLWRRDGRPRPGTAEAIAILDATLASAPDHPFANHLLIHAYEAAPDPSPADAAADRLRTLVPGMSHLVHMPSHIDVRRGRWDQAILANERAIALDRAYRQRTEAIGSFRFFMAHNNQMLAFAAMMSGRCRRAVAELRALVADLPERFRDDHAPYVDGYVAGPIEGLVRAGEWRAVLAEPEPHARFPFARAIRFAARGIAHAALGEVVAARREQTSFRAAQALIPAQTEVGANPGRAIAAVAERMLAGEILIAEGRIDAGADLLRHGIVLEDALRYDEPPGWLVPLRHGLGAALMKHGRAAQAEAVYRADLAHWPDNGWSLYGLAESLRAQGRGDEAAAVDERFARVWRDADIAITSSCLCVPGG
ncbi:MAG TPA: hypothetical protein VEL07_18405 [Planctomycetota bacterium]|nr:hypothetical protein [Planctomycetota bacterium]